MHKTHPWQRSFQTLILVVGAGKEGDLGFWKEEEEEEEERGVFVVSPPAKTIFDEWSALDSHWHKAKWGGLGCGFGGFPQHLLLHCQPRSPE